MKKIDELRSEVESAERLLKRKQHELMVAELMSLVKRFMTGDYVELLTIKGDRTIGRLVEIHGKPECFTYEVQTWSDKKIVNIDSIKKWQPKNGDLCIFWDNDYNEEATISIYLGTSGDDSFPYTSKNDTYQNCIPFISEKQFKEHIGYEN